MTQRPSHHLRPVPEPLTALHELAVDLRWTWSHAADRLWEAIEPEIWQRTANPWLVLENAPQWRLEALAADEGFLGELERVVGVRREHLERPTWFGETHGEQGLRIAYFSMEYGLGEALPLYSGGLGVLAGDHLKSASDLGVPIVAVGLLYQEGYFRQMLDADGVQLELYPPNSPSQLPITPVHDADGAWLSVTIELPGRELLLRVWRAQVGRVPLYLLDSNDPLNTPADRGITGKLYAGGQEMRFMQQVALGIGGWRVLEALELEPDVCHLNEGHAAMVTLERAGAYLRANGTDFDTALWATRAGNVFTTHTPVRAAFDTYPAPMLARYGTAYAEALGVEPEDLLALGRARPGEAGASFNMAYLAMRTCARVNAVSRLHGDVSRRIFSELFPRWPLDEVPVGHITNGVHFPSWDSPWADELWTDACGKERWRRGPVETSAESIACLDDETIWTQRSRERADLVDYARRRLVRQLGQRGADSDSIERAKEALDPNALTLGFARRFTEYKRPHLLLRDPERLANLLTNAERPVQLIVAGKAHPDDAEGKAFVREWALFVRRADVRAHAVFVEDYDMALAEQLVQGVDLWINTPRRPWEACGTSGMKVLVNGGLNLSVLDGWWAEAYSPEVGWKLGDGDAHDPAAADAADAQALYELLEQQIVPEFYSRDARGIPSSWVARIRASMSQLAPRFSGNRMVREYVESSYLPAAEAYRERAESTGRVAAELRDWASAVSACWHQVHFGAERRVEREGGFELEIQIYLGDVPPEAVVAELYAEKTQAGGPERVLLSRGAALAGAVHGYIYAASVETRRPARDFSIRVMPSHAEAAVPTELPLIAWQR